MSKWPQWWERLADRVREEGQVELTIDEIRESVPTCDHQLDTHGWWNALRNPNEDSCTGLLENGLECEPEFNGNLVERVVFRVRST